MRVLLLGMGSRGDVQPLVALGGRLLEHGYAVSLAAPADLGHVVAGSGLRFAPLSFDLEAPLREGLGRESLRGSARAQRGEARIMRQVLAGTAEALAGDVEGLVDEVDAVVSGALTFDLVDALLTTGKGARSGRRPGKPHLYAIFAPVWPSAYGESVALALLPRSVSVGNLAWSTFAGRVAFDLFRPAGDLIRDRRGLPHRRFRHYVSAARSTPTVLAASPSVVAPAPDWPPALRQTGYWVSESIPATGLDPVLATFLEAGPPPVFVGFGSMPTPDPVGVVGVVAVVLDRLGLRGVVSEGLGGLSVAGVSAGDLPNGEPNAGAVRVEPGRHSGGAPGLVGIGWAPHDVLFARCAVVVHHGGAGTTASAARAGVPQVIVPHAADQPYWGRRMAALGVAPSPIARKDLTRERLQRALTAALTPRAREAARLLGERLRGEDGAGDAARLMDGYLTGTG